VHVLAQRLEHAEAPAVEERVAPALPGEVGTGEMIERLAIQCLIALAFDQHPFVMNAGEEVALIEFCRQRQTSNRSRIELGRLDPKIGDDPALEGDDIEPARQVPGEGQVLRSRLDELVPEARRLL
jgi:hypothetical protein